MIKIIEENARCVYWPVQESKLIVSDQQKVWFQQVTAKKIAIRVELLVLVIKPLSWQHCECIEFSNTLLKVYASNLF